MITRLWFLVGVIAILLVVALFLRLARISSESMGGDETFSVRVASSRISQELDLVRQDLVHPPLYYLLLKLSLPTSRRPSALDARVLSLATGTALIVVAAIVGLVVPPLRGASLLAGFLIALNRTHIYYSQEVRSYALFCFIVGGLLLWGILMDRYGHKWTYWAAGTTIMTALLYTHYLGGFYCAALLVPILFGKLPKRWKWQATAAAALAFVMFLPWVFAEIPVYHAKSGLSANLLDMGLADWFSLKATFADYVGIPDFRGASTLAFTIGAVLFCFALLPRSRKEKDAVPDSRIRMMLAATALIPPLLAFFLAKPPFELPIFTERQVLPSILPALLLVCYGLWRIASRAPKPLLVLVLGAITLSALEALPVWSNWSGPSRQPNAAIADWLRRHDPDSPLYTTWPYGIGEPVMFYLEGRRPVYTLPGTPPMENDMTFYLEASRRAYAFPAGPATLPDKFIVLYRPTAVHENAVVRPLLDRFESTEEKCYSAFHSHWGTCVLVLQKRRTVASN